MSEMQFELILMILIEKYSRKVWQMQKKFLEQYIQNNNINDNIKYHLHAIFFLDNFEVLLFMTLTFYGIYEGINISYIYLSYFFVNLIVLPLSNYFPNNLL